MKKHVFCAFAFLMTLPFIAFAVDKEAEKEKTSVFKIDNRPEPKTEPFVPVSKCSGAYADGRVAKCVIFVPSSNQDKAYR